jgi:hypothetical protein
VRERRKRVGGARGVYGRREGGRKRKGRVMREENLVRRVKERTQGVENLKLVSSSLKTGDCSSGGVICVRLTLLLSELLSLHFA